MDFPMAHKFGRAPRKNRRPHRDGKSSSHDFRRCRLTLEVLEQRQLLSVNPVISEFMASNSATLTDYYGKNPDWLEIYNPDIVALDFSGWKLKDNNTVWTVPAGVTIPGRSYLKIFCDNRDVVAPNGELHSNFKLGAGGDYLGLLKPDDTVVSEYAPEYPEQYTDVSYGLVVEQSGSSLISAGAVAKALVPTTANGGSTLDDAWKGDFGYRTFQRVRLAVGDHRRRHAHDGDTHRFGESQAPAQRRRFVWRDGPRHVGRRA